MFWGRFFRAGPAVVVLWLLILLASSVSCEDEKENVPDQMDKLAPGPMDDIELHALMLDNTEAEGRAPEEEGRGLLPLGRRLQKSFQKRLRKLRDRTQNLQEILLLGNSTKGDSRNCVRRKADSSCPDSDMLFYYYPSDLKASRIKMFEPPSDFNANTLKNYGWDPVLSDVILVHGYMGGDGKVPMSVLRDAYRSNGNYNVFVLDWGALAKAPCYTAAVSNLRPVARCLAHLFGSLVHLRGRSDQSMCVGHSLGAHVCGLTSNFLGYPLHRIIALDPARPLVHSLPGVGKLDARDAHSVVVLHTNAGFYGESGRIGDVDFCINGGRSQPFCANSSNEALCSHLRSVCYLAESLDTESVRHAVPCARRCPTGARPGKRPGEPLAMGVHTPMGISGSFCLSNSDPPYCPTTTRSKGKGDKRCCILK
ncbi:phospholipase A1 VesT1.02-like isoform X1 [Ischnura elegans]|uniref:phospholipase A1 VesT1.02-like isoform X1 n=1 Tax=Ischnura elegans TaxID=197161 RepID=UPI001ED8A757|nr:phospholipase A1 VesT1.02-like isoform X1 [Ischnura elegans]